MNVNRIYAAYFSPTGTTRKVVTHLADAIAGKLKLTVENWDFTFPEQRLKHPEPTASDLFILGLPVYAGRLPNLLLNYLSSFIGHGALAVPIVLFGNRSYGNALIELRDLLEDTGFHTIAAAAFVGQHSFSEQLAPKRPDIEDLKIADRFAEDILSRINNIPASASFPPIEVPGIGAPGYGGYYQPLGYDQNPVHFLKAKPITTRDCIHCKRCVSVCPLGSIDQEEEDRITGICIKCNACIKICPVNAKQLTDPAYLSHLQYLESTYLKQAAVELF